MRGPIIPERHAQIRRLWDKRDVLDLYITNPKKGNDHTTLHTTQRVTVHVLQAEALIQGTSGMQVYGR